MATSRSSTPEVVSDSEAGVLIGDIAPLNQQISELKQKDTAAQAELSKLQQEIARLKKFEAQVQQQEAEQKLLPQTMGQLQQIKDRYVTIEKKDQDLKKTIAEKSKAQSWMIRLRSSLYKEAQETFSTATNVHEEKFKKPYAEMKEELNNKRVGVKSHIHNIVCGDNKSALNPSDKSSDFAKKLTQIELLAQQGKQDEKKYLDGVQSLYAAAPGYKQQHLVPAAKTLLLWTRVNNAIHAGAKDLAAEVTKQNENASLELKLPAMDRNDMLTTYGGRRASQALLGEFCGALSENKFDRAERLLAKGININKVMANDQKISSNSVSLLWWSLLNNKQDLTIWLLNHGANPNQTITFADEKRVSGQTPLIYLARNNVNLKSDKVAQLLFAKGANLDAQDKNGDAALHWSAKHNNEDNVRLLCEKGARKDIKNANSSTPHDVYWLHSAASNNHNLRLQRLLEVPKPQMTMGGR
jgi:hypothetical protein